MRGHRWILLFGSLNLGRWRQASARALRVFAGEHSVGPLIDAGDAHHDHLVLLAVGVRGVEVHEARNIRAVRAADPAALVAPDCALTALAAHAAFSCRLPARRRAVRSIMRWRALDKLSIINPPERCSISCWITRAVQPENSL